MSVSYEWFESLCDTLSKNPVAATQALEQFRESDVAVDSCLFFLSNPNISQVAMFQAVSILHRSSIARWEILSVEKRREVQNRVMELLMLSMERSAPHYLINKLMQVCASIRKRGWLEFESERNVYFQFIQSLMQNPSTSQVATALLRVTLEEFANQSFAEVNIQYSLHAEVKLSFQQKDLLNVFALVVQPLNILLAWQPGSTLGPLGQHFPLMAELFKLLSELICWNFEVFMTNIKSIALSDENTNAHNQSNLLPAEWREHLIQSDFVVKLFGMFNACCNKNSSQEFGVPPQVLESCTLELRNLILCLPTISGDIFSSPSEKVGYGNCILECATSLVQPFIVRTDSRPMTIEEWKSDYAEGGVRFEQLELFLNIFLRIVSNHKLSSVVQMSVFEQCLAVLGTLSEEICKELLYLSQMAVGAYHEWLGRREEKLTRERGGELGTYDNPSDTLLMSTWRGDVLALCLDAWCVVLEDSAIIAVIASGGTFGAGAGSSFGSPGLSTWLTDVAAKIFQSSFHSVYLTLIFETLTEAEQEEDEENALIEGRETGDLLIGICTLGRAGLAKSLRTVTGVLQESFNDLTSRATQQQEQTYGAAACAPLRSLEALEKCRVCVEITSFLLIDNFDPEVEQMCKETPVINETIVQHLMNDNATIVTDINSAVTLITMILQWETQLMVSRSSASLLSPLLMRSVYRFYREYTLRYMDPNLELYGDDVSPFLRVFYGG
jgi:hypothetical protein